MRDFIERIEDELPGTVVVADMEAGLEHLSRSGGTLAYADVLLVQVLVPLVIAVVFAPEPTKSLLPRLPGKRRARS